MRCTRSFKAVFLSIAVVLLTSCWNESATDSVTREECERLRDHVVDLRMQSVTADADQHRIALRSAFDESYVSSCVDSSDQSYVQCAVAATDLDALGACAPLTAR